MQNLYIHKLDTATPGLFVVRVSAPMLNSELLEMRDALEKAIQEFSKESKVILLGPEFAPLCQPTDEEMKELG